MNETLIGCKGWIIKSPIVEVISCTVPIPVLSWKVDGDFHPMPLCLIVTILRRVAGTRVRMKGDCNSNQQSKQRYGQKSSFNSFMNQPPTNIIMVVQINLVLHDFAFVQFPHAELVRESACRILKERSVTFQVESFLQLQMSKIIMNAILIST